MIQVICLESAESAVFELSLCVLSTELRFYVPLDIKWVSVSLGLVPKKIIIREQKWTTQEQNSLG